MRLLGSLAKCSAGYCTGRPSESSIAAVKKMTQCLSGNVTASFWQSQARRQRRGRRPQWPRRAAPSPASERPWHLRQPPPWMRRSWTGPALWASHQRPRRCWQRSPQAWRPSLPVCSGTAVPTPQRQSHRIWLAQSGRTQRPVRRSRRGSRRRCAASTLGLRRRCQRRACRHRCSRRRGWRCRGGGSRGAAAAGGQGSGDGGSHPCANEHATSCLRALNDSDWGLLSRRSCQICTQLLTRPV